MASAPSSRPLNRVRSIHSHTIDAESLNVAVVKEPTWQPDLVSFIESPERLTGAWRPTSTEGKCMTLEEITPKATLRKALIHDYRRVRISPYNPELWCNRAITHLALGYPELAVADAYRARLLCEIFFENGSLYFDVKISVMATMVSHGIPMKETHGKIMHAVKHMDLRASCVMAQGLISLEAYHDGVAFIKEACGKYPDSKVLKGAKAVIQRGQLQSEVFVVADRPGTVRLDDERYTQGRVNRIMYPWVRRSVFEISNKQLKKCKSRFEAVTSQAAIKEISPGRFGVFSKNSIPKGQVILEDPSLFTIMNRDSGGEFCATCSKTLSFKKISVPCCKARFCNEKCRDEALNTYHKVMCKKDFSWLYARCKNAHLESKELVPLLMVKVLATAVQTNAKPLNTASVSTLPAGYGNALPSSFRLWENIIGPVKVLQTLGVNIFTDLRFDTWVMQTLFLRIDLNKQARPGTWILSGIYPSLSMLNHDCGPNSSAEQGSSGTITMRANRDIKEGEEVTVCWIDAAQPEQSRRSQIRKVLGKDCDCMRCLRERNFYGLW